MKQLLLVVLLIVLVALAIAAGTSTTGSNTATTPAIRRASIEADRCAECHQEIVNGIQSAPHGNTLRPVGDELVRERFQGPATVADREYRFEAHDGIELSVDGHPARESIAWVFGSGHHAQTPVSLLTNPRGQTEIRELAVTWYRGHGLQATPGSDGLLVDPPPWPSLGTHHDHVGTLECFGCHTTTLPVEDGRIQFDGIVSGVRCTRCHTKADQHVDTIEDGTLSLDRWSELSPLESISRCGECHRRPDEFTQDEITVESKMIVRFAPVGLSQSRCFTSQKDQSRRLDCMTCHDPHQPARTDPSYYVARCNECHSGASTAEPVCGNPAVQRDSQKCLDCHMPKVESNPWLSFTDHWIRIRE